MAVSKRKVGRKVRKVPVDSGGLDSSNNFSEDFGFGEAEDIVSKAVASGVGVKSRSVRKVGSKVRKVGGAKSAGVRSVVMGLGGVGKSSGAAKEARVGKGDVVSMYRGVQRDLLEKMIRVSKMDPFEKGGEVDEKLLKIQLSMSKHVFDVLKGVEPEGDGEVVDNKEMTALDELYREVSEIGERG